MSNKMMPKEMITVEKEVYEAVLRNSIKVNDLEEENQQLKELLKECIKHFDELLLGLQKADVKHFVGIPYYPSLEFVNYLNHINNAIGEKK